MGFGKSCHLMLVIEVLGCVIPGGDATLSPMQEAQVQLRELLGRGLSCGVNV